MAAAQASGGVKVNLLEVLIVGVLLYFGYRLWVGYAAAHAGASNATSAAGPTGGEWYYGSAWFPGAGPQYSDQTNPGGGTVVSGSGSDFQISPSPGGLMPGQPGYGIPGFGQQPGPFPRPKPVGPAGVVLW